MPGAEANDARDRRLSVSACGQRLLSTPAVNACSWRLPFYMFFRPSVKASRMRRAASAIWPAKVPTSSA